MSGLSFELPASDVMMMQQASFRQQLLTTPGVSTGDRHGERVEPRRDFIRAEAHKVQNLDV